MWVNSSDLLLQVMNDNHCSTTPTFLLDIQHPPHLHSFITELLSEQTLFEKRDGIREREKYSDKHLLVVLNFMQFIISSVFLCAKPHLFSSSNRICLQVFSVNKYSKRPSLYFSHLDVTHPFFSLFSSLLAFTKLVLKTVIVFMPR